MFFTARRLFYTSFFTILLSTFYLLSSVTSVNAQTPNYPQRDTHTYVQQVMLDVMAALSCNIAGVDPSGPALNGKPKKCLGYDPTNGKLGFVETNGGAIGAMGSFIAILYTPPISTQEYTQYLVRNFGIVKPVYAQGFGFEGLNPLISVWTVFRNLVYLLFAVTFVVVGFAVMLRIHIDPRTVMTIQNQIPKLIIALILVTFSYAIAAFLVEIMYVSIFLLFGILASAGISLGNFEPLSIQGKNALQVFNDILGFTDVSTRAAGGVKDMIIGMFTTPDIISQNAGGIPVLSGLWDFMTGGFRNILGFFVGYLVGILAVLIISVAILWALFRLWFQLIMAYVLFLLDVLFAPFWILGGIFPGSPIGFGSWLRSALSNLSPFPATIGMFLVAKIIIEKVKTTSPGEFFVPPLIGNPGDASEALAAFIALGFILLTPQVVTMMKDFLKSPQFKYTPAIGQALGVGPGVLGGITTAVASPYGALAQFRGLREAWQKGGVRGLLGGIPPIKGAVGPPQEAKSQ